MKQDKRADLLKMLQQEPDEFEVESVPVAYSYRCRLNRPFEDISQFSSLIDVLEQATTEDTVLIRLASPGGSLDAIIPVLAAMDSTEASIHCHVDTSIASAATFIMLKGHMITFNRHSDAMLHNIQYGAGGHAGNVEARVNHVQKTGKHLIKEVYKDFIDDNEMQRLFDGLEIYLTADECIERLKSRAEKQQPRVEDLSEEQLLEQFLKDNPELVEEESPKPKKEKRIKVPSTKKSVVE